MDRIFDKYAKYYDLLYSDKDYEKECDFIESVFEKFSEKKPKEILDLGCGTGGHMIILLKRGYNVVGMDPSEAMAELAKEKIRKLGLGGDVVVKRMSDFHLDKLFDAAICMFAVMNYIVDTDELIKSLSNVRRHLRKGAIFLFDFWYGPAVLNIKPSTRIKVIENPDIRLIRTVTPEMDTFMNIVKSHYHLIVIKGDRVVDEVRETHCLRYFFPQELIYFLRKNGFEPLKFCEFPKLDSEPSDTTWNVATIARAI